MTYFGSYRQTSLRLKDYDYSGEGAYFVTICTDGRKPYFAIYAQLKAIVLTRWQRLPERYPHITLDSYVIMPNHVHAIIIIGLVSGARSVEDGKVPGGATAGGPVLAARGRGGGKGKGDGSPSLGDMIGAYKSICAVEWLKYAREAGLGRVPPLWQKNYYEHIIRDEKELERIHEYIENDPLKWEYDQENPDHVVDVGYVRSWNWLEKPAGKRNP